MITMNEAISKGYHHLGCKHIDIDYYSDVTIIPENKYSIQHKQTKYQLRLKHYKFEQKIRDLKYKLENTNLSQKKIQSFKKQLETEFKKMQYFLHLNNIQQNKKRENPYIDDVSKFS